MRVEFCLAWAKSQKITASQFKLGANYELICEYVKRTTQYAQCQIIGTDMEKLEKKPGDWIWMCHIEPPAKELKSEMVAQKLSDAMNRGAQRLKIIIGAPDGFTKEHIEKLRPDLLWSFGPLTLPHELATVVATEQVYRAYTILGRHPYHLGH